MLAGFTSLNIYECVKNIKKRHNCYMREYKMQWFNFNELSVCKLYGISNGSSLGYACMTNTASETRLNLSREMHETICFFNELNSTIERQ